MALVTSFFAVDPRSGINLNSTQTINTTTNPEYPAPNLAVGDICQGVDGSQWVFVKASTTVTAFNVVMIDNGFNANNCSFSQANGVSLQKTLGLAEFQTGVGSPAVANAGDYFWAQIAGRGGSAVNVLSTAAANAQLYISSSSPGSVTTTVASSATNATLFNAAVNSSLTGATVAVELIFQYMRASI
jgi:hypothetical protein